METPQPPQANPETQIDEAQLEKATNEMYGWSSDEQPEEPEESQAQEPETTEAEEEAAPVQEPGKDAGQSFETIKPFLDDTPFKGDDIVKGVEGLSKSYKELQAQHTKDRQRFKPHEDLIDLLEKDAEFKQAVHQLRQFKDNPDLLKAYLPNSLQPPDPSHFDIYQPEGKAQYDKALADYVRESIARETDSRLNARFAELDRQRMRERQHTELKAQFPDANPEEVEKYAMEKARTLGLADFYKLQNYDSREAALTEKIRKETTSKMQQAQSAKTPEAIPPKETIQMNDVLKHVARYNVASAEKKYGRDVVFKVLQASTNAGWSPE